ncbi:hypothetical protein [Pseudooceanicola marinus]|uniref:hypothetical protein n=1 Tax=Pseudooceanicola marinus TaxID=396013 RepID=UPI001179BE2E|nr:hypothetical protein [Pseudooceanicola marinus]
MYTDLQSIHFLLIFKSLAPFSYQDKVRTDGESDTRKTAHHGDELKSVTAQGKAAGEAATSADGTKEFYLKSTYSRDALLASGRGAA